ncbi:uncharacterized protein LOC120339224 [Styela clava]
MAEIPAISYDTLYTSRKDSEGYLGQGTFSTVFRCYHHAHGDVAVKVLKKCGRNPITSFNKEGLMHLKANSSPHILSLHGIAQQGGFVCLVLEYMPFGDLASLLTSHNIEIPWTVRLRVLFETASALTYLHNFSEDKRFIHCDLKAENILLSADLHAKIADFGGSTLSSYTGATAEMSRSGSYRPDDGLIQYTLSHAAPELLGQLDGKRTPYMDIYSFAIVMYVVTSRNQPFRAVPPHLIEHCVKGGQRPREGLEKIKTELAEKHIAVDQSILNCFFDLMENCWKTEPKERLPMDKVRARLHVELRNILDSTMSQDVNNLKSKMPAFSRGGMPQDPIGVLQKFRHYESNPSIEVCRPHQSRWHTVSPEANPPFRRSEQQQPQPSTSQLSRSFPVQPVDELSSRMRNMQIPGPPIHSATQPTNPQSPSGIRELEASFADPYLREGNNVRMITDVAAIKNAQIGHGGWNDSLLQLRDMIGIVKKVEDNGDVTVSFSGVQSHRFNSCSLVKIPSESDFHIGDLVCVTLDKEIVQIMQKDHGGWVNDMDYIFKQTGLIFRFLQEGDILAVYKNGLYFRFNPDVLCKTSGPGDLEELCLRDNPNIKIGDYVCHDMEEDVMRELQEWSGGWNSEMSSLKGRVGKLVYADYHGRTFVAYNSKCCYVFNPAAITKLSENEAIRRFKNHKDEMKKHAKLVVESKINRREFAIGDVVRVHLPLDVMIEMQRGHGGWCYQMLEVYGLTGKVKDFDGSHNVQVLFDTGNKWTFNPAVLDITSTDGSVPPPLYVPPFLIGDKVRVKIEDLNNERNMSMNKVRHVCKLLEISEEKVDILTKTGVVAGIDDDFDVIVTFGEGKSYGIKPEQLEKIT